MTLIYQIIIIVITAKADPFSDDLGNDIKSRLEEICNDAVSVLILRNG